MESQTFQERPRICLLDVEDHVSKALKAAGFNCFDGTLGSVVNVPKSDRDSTHYLRPDFEFPDNLHEYDIVAVDLQNPNRHGYYAPHNVDTKGQSFTWIISHFPQNVCDLRPLGAAVLAEALPFLRTKESILIVFAAADEQSEYFLSKISRGGKHEETTSHSLYDFLPQKPDSGNVSGIDTELAIPENNEIGRLLRKHNSTAKYSIVFGRAQKKKEIEKSDFQPLMVVSANSKSIVGFVDMRNQKHGIFVFPHIKNKPEFLLDLFQKVLPDAFPNLFPYSTQFMWLKHSAYQLPNEKKLLDESTALKSEYKQKFEALDKRIQANHEQFAYLHDLLTQSDDRLVKTVENYFKWLGFDSVVNVDETDPTIRGEDLRIETDNGLLVIEVKGIGGTSTDSDCSQINKIKYRKAEERGKFDVFGLYLVNHQRYLPPEKRKNPPFTDTQIQDALNEKRGLLTTYDLFKLHFNVANGFVRKEDARFALVEIGLVKFFPSEAAEILITEPLHHDRHVAVVKLVNTPITNGSEIIFEDGGYYSATNIVELMVDGTPVDAAENGEIGIKLADKLPKSTRLWLRKACGSARTR